MFLYIEQGSEQWHTHRAQNFNASDAPAMMGVSPHETRDQLLMRLALGKREEPEWKRRLYEEGHRAEALCRPLAEEILFDEMRPCVAHRAPLSASLDGRTTNGIDWEHKLLNNELRAMIPGGPVLPAPTSMPLLYTVQVAHQQFCSDAQETLFSASEWSTDGRLLDERHCFIKRDPELIRRVTAGWVQFSQDLEELKRKIAAGEQVVVEERPAAQVVNTVPALSVVVTGTAMVDSNLVGFQARLKEFIEQMPRDPESDQDFANLKRAGKLLEDVETGIKGQKAAMLARITSIAETTRVMDECAALARGARLGSEKLVTRKEQEIKARHMGNAQRELAAFVADINATQFGGRQLVPLPAVDWVGAVKGVRSMASLLNGFNTALAQGKIKATERANQVHKNLAIIAAAGEQYAGLFEPDLGSLVLRDEAALQAIVSTRVNADMARRAATPAPTAAPSPAPPPAPAVPASVYEPGATVKLADICARLGWNLTSAKIQALGFRTTTNRSTGATILLKAADLPALKAALHARVDAL